MSQQQDSQEKNSFKDTLNLPQTDFPIRANSKIDDPAMIARWDSEKLYEAIFEQTDHKEKFIFHDGPPYANGHIHLGSAYNKILKDIVCKSQRMAGKHVPVTPGWDCHGLPIELKVTKEHPGLAPQELKRECRKYAQQWVDVQRQEFKNLGVLMNWDHPYLTMAPTYESAIVRAFGICVKKGFIEKKNKTVPWCASCQTVLATAEIEYHERKDPSIYVLFDLTQSDKQRLFPSHKDHDISFLVWTTTPWTLPLNRAVLLNPSAAYALVKTGEKYFIIAQPLVERLEKLLEQKLEIIDQKQAVDFLGVNVNHPFVPGLQVPIILDQSVSLQDGTAAVHCAPGCGPEDYEVALRNNLEIFSPINPDGTYSKGIEPRELIGMAVADGQIWVLKKLQEVGKLLFKQSIRHSYPHCWRCRNGLIFRATKQWFLNLAHEGLREKALKAIEKIRFIPTRSSGFLQATISGRLEWCISRQRVWGVPIVALLCKHCGWAYANPEFIERVAQGVQKDGIEFWDTVPVEELLPEKLICGSCSSTEFVKEHDILDVWFDSGVSHFAVLYHNKQLGFPADMYLEGLDQHRGWFQSSLLTSLVLEEQAAMKSIVTHGFTVDDEGHKMSKSLGNVVTPQEIIGKIGTDGLRLWASSIDFGGDAVVSQGLLENIAQVYRKIRNTARFLLSNLYDFDQTKDVLEVDQLLLIDQMGFQQLIETNNKIQDAYKRTDFTAVFHHLADYCAKDLSSYYLDIIKDRLYVEKADGHKRRSAQTVCWYILDTLTKLIAPILSFTAEQVSDLYQKNKQVSIHLQVFNHLEKIFPQSLDEKTWYVLMALRATVLKALEDIRAQGIIRHSLEAQVTFYMADDQLKLLYQALQKSGQSVEDFLKEYFIVSQCIIKNASDGLQESSELKGLFLQVGKAAGRKCPRCWQWDNTDHDQGLCRRCQSILISTAIK